MRNFGNREKRTNADFSCGRNIFLSEVTIAQRSRRHCAAAQKSQSSSALLPLLACVLNVKQIG